MQTLSEMLNFSDRTDRKEAVKIDKRKDINVYETLCLYCANNDVNLKDISDQDFEGAVEIIENYAFDAPEIEFFYFWIDANN